MARFHGTEVEKRSVVVLSPDDYDGWLDGGKDDAIRALLRPMPPEEFTAGQPQRVRPQRLRQRFVEQRQLARPHCPPIPVSQAARDALMAKVTAQGFVDDYPSIRVSASGRRFVIEQTTIWNLVDDQGHYQGHAAKFDHWTYV